MKGIEAYSRTRVESAPNEQLLVMLLEKAMEKELVAITAMQAGDRAAWNGAVHHARAIYIELLGALDGSFAPELARSVGTTWRWCIHQLGVAQRSGDHELVERVRAATATMHEAWVQAIASAVDGEREAS